ncbi:MAG TPA: prephenate dehydrogenase/arogenate dehydrogenase family protein [Steroidobacteraceae bacterium]|nr:prephenate dehydrogenase/arogenate dehydrogenase family protein [Steroidobacteraceae bacterium]
MDLGELRERLTRLDGELLALIAERQRLSEEVARAKRATGHPTRDFQRERDVLMNARVAAGKLGLPPALADNLLRLLIRSSLATQEQAQLAAQGQGAGRRALVIGGHGKMGRWFAEFLESQGYAVEVADPAGPLGTRSHRNDWQSDELSHELIVVATPLGITASILEQLARHRPPGLVFDIGSLKTPLRKGLESLREAGVRVASLHPMFGPDTDLLSGRHIIHVDVGRPDAVADAQALFASTMVEQVVTTLDDHDRLIAYVLGLSHAINIAFFTALAESGEAAPQLARLSSTTFDAQLAVASLVAGESPALYFEIQALNQYGGDSLAALVEAVTRLQSLVVNQDAAGFARLMRRGQTYLQDRAAARQT